MIAVFRMSLADSRTVSGADKTTRDLKTANLRKQREAKEAGEVGKGLKKGKR